MSEHDIAVWVRGMHPWGKGGAATSSSTASRCRADPRWADAGRRVGANNPIRPPEADTIAQRLPGLRVPARRFAEGARLVGARRWPRVTPRVRRGRHRAGPPRGRARSIAGLCEPSPWWSAPTTTPKGFLAPTAGRSSRRSRLAFASGCSGPPTRRTSRCYARRRMDLLRRDRARLSPR